MPNATLASRCARAATLIRQAGEGCASARCYADYEAIATACDDAARDNAALRAAMDEAMRCIRVGRLGDALYWLDAARRGGAEVDR